MAHDPGSLAPVYFDTAQDVLQWQPRMANPLMAATVPLASRMPATGVRFLMGLDNGPWTYWPEFDASPQGGHRGNVYNFQYWQYVDAMYYYVHRLVSVPPAVWINAAHRNGVKVFSAVTADFDGGGDQFNALFATQPEAAAHQLYLLASTYGFDGWMIDVENEAVASSNVRRAMEALKKMSLPNHQPVEVGYYEAGEFGINAHTYRLFLAGTFFQVDYTDGPGHPKRSYSYLVRKKQEAARFATYWSVLTNTYCRSAPPGINTGYAYLDIHGLCAHLEEAKNPHGDPDYYQSLGIYGPALTMYGGRDSTSDPLPTREQFHETDRLFWVGDNPTRTATGTLSTTTPAVSNYIPARSSIVGTPFVTRFNTGEGSFFALNGQPIAHSEWNHLSCQDRLPTWLLPVGGLGAHVKADYSYAHAYDGGSSLAFQGSLAPRESVEFALYLAQIPMALPTRVTFRYTVLDGASRLPYLKLALSDGTSVVVPGSAGQGWLKATRDLGPQPAHIVQIGLGFENSTAAATTVNVAVGEFSVVQGSPIAPPPLLTPARAGTLLTWQAPTGLWEHIWYYNVLCAVAGGVTLVGRTLVPAYDLSAPLFPPSGQNYRIQPVTTTGDASLLPSLVAHP